MASCLDRIEKIDCLVNNAGVSIKNKPVADITEEDWDLTMETNARGYFFVSKYALKKMSKGACIVNISSAPPRPEETSYPFLTLLPKGP